MARQAAPSRPHLMEMSRFRGNKQNRPEAEWTKIKERLQKTGDISGPNKKILLSLQ